MFFRGFLKQGDHVVITCYEHNAILRPLHEMKLKGIIDYSVISREDLILSPQEIYDKYVKSNTVLFETTLASNLTGRIVFNPEVLIYMKEKGINTFVDSSQGAGKIELSMKEDGIDYLAFTGHKDLLALPGVGGLVCTRKPAWKPLLQGGTGVLGDSYVNPDVFPEAYEAGTLNMPAIWSLKVALDWLKDNKKQCATEEQIITQYFIDGLDKIRNVVLYDKEFQRVGVIGLNINGMKSNEVVQYLDENDICTRGGIHCAILAHEALNTKEIGVVRFSIGLNNTKSDIDRVLEVIKKVGE